MYQNALQMVAAVVFPMMILIGLLVLYLGLDVNSECTWCRYISCVPFPPGDDPWWRCGRCTTEASDVKAAFFAHNNTVMMDCPGGASLSNLPFTGDTLTSEELMDLCVEYCPDG